MTATRVTTIVAPNLAEAANADTASCVAAAHDVEPETVLTRSRTTDTCVIVVAGLGRAVRKRWWWPGTAERIKGLGRTTALARTPAEREFVALGRTYGDDALAFHPTPLAARVERRGGFAVRAMLLMTEIAGAVELALFLRDERDPRRRRDVLLDLAARTAAMHGAGVADGDFHARNLLVQPASARVWKVDCPRQRACTAPLGHRRADLDLACVDVALALFATRAERLRALRHYLGGAPRREQVRRRARAVGTLRRGSACDRERHRLPPAAGAHE